MTWKEKLFSRKLWITIAPLIAVLVADFTGYAIDPNVLIGVAGIVGAYVLGQGYVDAKTGQSAITAAADVGKLQLMQLVNELQAQVESAGQDAVNEFIEELQGQRESSEVIELFPEE